MGQWGSEEQLLAWRREGEGLFESGGISRPRWMCSTWRRGDDVGISARMPFCGATSEPKHPLSIILLPLIYSSKAFLLVHVLSSRHMVQKVVAPRQHILSCRSIVPSAFRPEETACQGKVQTLVEGTPLPEVLSLMQTGSCRKTKESNYPLASLAVWAYIGLPMITQGLACSISRPA